MADADMYMHNCWLWRLFNFIAQSGLVESGEACMYSLRCVNVCFCAVGEALVFIETSMQNKVIELSTQASNFEKTLDEMAVLGRLVHFMCLCSKVQCVIQCVQL